MLVESQRMGSESSASELDHDDLHDGNEALDSEVQPVIHDALEDIPLTLQEFSGVNGVEDLHEHENVEEDSEVVAVEIIPHEVSQFSVGRNAKDCIAVEDDSSEHYDLENRLSDDVDGHHGSNNAVFAFLVRRTL